MELKHKVVSGIKFTTVSTVVTVGVQFFRIVILTRFIDKADFGLAAIVSIVLGFTNLFSDLGFSVALMHKQEVSKEEFSSIFWLNGGVNLSLFLVLLLASPMIASFYSYPVLNMLIPLMGLQLIFASFGKLYSVRMEKEFKFFFISIRDIVGAVISLAVAFFGAYFGMGVYSIIISTLSNVLIVNVLNFVSEYRAFPLTWHFSYDEAKGFLKIGMYQTGAQILDFFSSKLDIILISKFFGTADLGIYSLAKELVMKPIAILSKIVNSVSLPLFSKLQADDFALKYTYTIIIRSLTLVTFPILAFFFLCSEQVVTLFYGSKYNEVIPLFQILIFWCLVVAVSSPSSMLSIAKGKTNLNLYWTMILIFFNTIIIFTASYYSISSVAYGLNVSAALSYYLYWKYVINKLIPLSFREYFFMILPSLSVALISLLITIPITVVISIDMYFVELLVFGSILSFIYLTLTWLLNRKSLLLLFSFVRL
jgi:O-antigen/teichoic acid export membrane protein